MEDGIMKNGYERTYDFVIKFLQKCDFGESAKRLNLEQLSKNEIIVNFLDRKYIITKNSIDLVEEEIKWSFKTENNNYNIKSVLGYYLLSDANVEPENDFCMLSHFTHIGVFTRERNEDWSKSLLTQVYRNYYNKFCKVAEKLGMLFEGERTRGQYIWKYTLLPKIPVKIIYYEGDDEYPTKLQILYDKTAIQVLKFEPLAFLHICFTEGLAAIGEKTAVL
jgi:hypothetical protein